MRAARMRSARRVERGKSSTLIDDRRGQMFHGSPWLLVRQEDEEIAVSDVSKLPVWQKKTISRYHHLVFDSRATLERVWPALTREQRMLVEAEQDQEIGGLYSFVVTTELERMYVAPVEGETTIEQWCEWFGKNFWQLLHVAIKFASPPKKGTRHNPDWLPRVLNPTAHSENLFVDFLPERASLIASRNIRRTGKKLNDNRLSVDENGIILNKELPDGKPLTVNTSGSRIAVPLEGRFTGWANDSSSGSVSKVPFSPHHPPQRWTGLFEPKSAIRRTVPLDLL